MDFDMEGLEKFIREKDKKGVLDLYLEVLRRKRSVHEIILSKSFLKFKEWNNKMKLALVIFADVYEHVSDTCGVKHDEEELIGCVKLLVPYILREDYVLE
ncbi:hypothetical protein ENBRE01_1114 [Enteropsectra breve]|nr:hypothetical protein ENBRE01_1114 [Enteropsectra breve]